MFFNESLASFNLLGVERVYFGNLRSEHGLKINGVVVGLMGW